MRSGWLVVLAACGSSTFAPPAPARPVAAAQPKAVDLHASIAVRERADKALHEDAPLDYERPFTSKPFDRSATASLFASACDLGDKHACIVAAQLVPLDSDGQSYRAVVANCRAGDLLSCRALPPDDRVARFADAPGAMSRRAECQKYEQPAPCSVDALRTECSAGFPAACSEIGSSKSPPPDGEDLFARSPQLSMRGCRGGIARECEKATQYGSQGDQVDIAQRLCDLRPAECAELALVYKHSKDAGHERDALERACEYGGDRWVDCAELGTAYLDNRLEEPVPGRGQALLDWACPKIAANLHDGWHRAAPGCARAHADMK